LFYADGDRWPAQADLPDLDKYMDKPLVKASPPRYKRIFISEVANDRGDLRSYVGVELITGKNGTPGIKKAIANKHNKYVFDGALAKGKAPKPYVGSNTVCMILK
jgi:hypothetical protein